MPEATLVIQVRPFPVATERTIVVPPTSSDGPPMITYPFPLRPGVRGSVTLPEDLSPQEARRLGAFVAAIAMGDEVSDGIVNEEDLY